MAGAAAPAARPCVLWYRMGMRRLLLAISLIVAGMLPAAEEPSPEERYGPTFYGVELPETGARVLLLIDASKSMGRKDGARTDGGTRWDTLVDEVTNMAATMHDLATRRRVCFTVSLLYESGEGAHGGTEPFDLAQAGAEGRVVAALREKRLVPGGDFSNSFGTLWPLVARQHITHVFFLGDNDIARHADAVRPIVSGWYALPRRDPAPDQRELWKQKVAWWEPWAKWRPQRPGRPAFRAQRALNLPPPPRDVTFSCIAIGQASPFLKELAGLGKGEYVERLSKKRRSK